MQVAAKRATLARVASVERDADIRQLDKCGIVACRVGWSEWAQARTNSLVLSTVNVEEFSDSASLAS